MNLLKKIAKKRRYLVFLFDIIIIFLAYIGIQFFIRDTFKINDEIFYKIVHTSIITVIFYEIFFIFMKLHKSIIKYEGGKDYLLYVLICIGACVSTTLIGNLFNLNILNVKHNIITSLIMAIGIISYRIIIRLILNYENTQNKSNEEKEKKLLIIGAGLASRDIIKSIKRSMKNVYDIIGIIDDNEEKIGCIISGVEVLGDRTKILSVCKENKVDTIFFSISKISKQDRKEIIEICQNTGAKVRILPSTEDLIRNKPLMDNLRDIEIEDILGRDPIKLDNNNISELINGRVVLVTGGGGSIGSELCRQIAKFTPKQLIIFDIYENNLYNIEMELRQNYSKLDLKAIVGSVRDKAKLENLFEWEYLE